MNTWRILHGDVRARLAELPDQSVQTCATSPPYFGLRDYGHDGQIGLEPSPAEYVAALVAVFADVWRVLRDDGTLWLNLGDTYAGARGQGLRGGPPSTSSTLQGNGHQGGGPKLRAMTPSRRRDDAACPRSDLAVPGLKPKDLIGIPWRVAFALQDAGWYLRSDIVWHKPNPMPESVTDRPTKAHEYLFLLSKSERYLYDAAAIAEPASSAMVEQMKREYEGQALKDYAGAGVQNPSDVKRRIIAGKSGNKERRYGDQVGSPNDHMGRSFPWEGVTRNKRTVWTVTTQPFPGAHFAVMPDKLVEPCILAGTSEKGECRRCGAPWLRELTREDRGYDGSRYGERAVAAAGGAITGGVRQSTLGSSHGAGTGVYTTAGWAPSCECNAGEPVPQCVLDPFAGAGTVGAVAAGLGRSFVGVELNAAYVAIARARIGAVAPLFAREQPDDRPEAQP